MKNGQPTTFDDLASITMLRTDLGAWWANIQASNGAPFPTVNSAQSPEKVLEFVVKQLQENDRIEVMVAAIDEELTNTVREGKSQSPELHVVSPTPTTQRRRPKHRKR